MSVTDLFEEIPDKSSESLFGESDEMFVIDGPNYSYFYLTWRVENGEETKYSIAFHATIDLMLS